MVQLGASLPFGQAVALLKSLTGIDISVATLLRWTEAIGRQAVAQQDAEVALLHRHLPEPHSTPERQVRAYRWRNGTGQWNAMR